MVEIWYAILALMLTTYLVLDGRNFGIGTVRLFVAKTPVERQQVVAAIGPLWSWHEVWLISTGGILFVAFPRFLSAAFSGYYLALFLVLWALILRGMALEVGGHMDNRLWQSFWDFVLTLSSILMAVLLGAALGNVARGVPLDGSGEFHLPFFTNFGVRGQVGLLDWYTVSLGIFTLLLFGAHGTTYLAMKTNGAVQERSAQLARRLWWVLGAGLVIITIETWCVRPDLFGIMVTRPLAWLALLGVLAGGWAIYTGLRRPQEPRAFIGSCVIIYGFLGAGATAFFPELLHSTLAAEHSFTAYNSASGPQGLAIALIWWPFALLLSLVYWYFVLKHYRGKVEAPADGSAY